MSDTTGSTIRLVAVTRKPTSASFEQRVLNFIEPLKQHGIDLAWRQIPKGVIAQRRFVRQLADCHGVWWHRHLLMWGNVRALRRAARKLVFDFDDPVTMSARRNKPAWSRQVRFATLLKRCDAALAASAYLAELAKPHCANTTIVPMAIDQVPDASPKGDMATITELLWLGSRATQPYLEQIRPALEQLGEARSDVRLRLVAHHAMTFGKLEVDFQPWSPEAQDQALRQCHIGLCPMPDTPWTRGKCPYKVLQYMAYGMPWVGAAVGENLTTAGSDDDTRRGRCAADHRQWLAMIGELADDPALCQSMGQHGMEYIAEHHDRHAIAKQLAAFWRALVGRT